MGGQDQRKPMMSENKEENLITKIVSVKAKFPKGTIKLPLSVNKRRQIINSFWNDKKMPMLDILHPFQGQFLINDLAGSSCIIKAPQAVWDAVTPELKQKGFSVSEK